MYSSSEIPDLFPEPSGGSLQPPIEGEALASFFHEFFDTLEDTVFFDVSVAIFPQLVLQENGVFCRYKELPSETFLKRISLVLSSHLDGLPGLRSVDSNQLHKELLKQAGLLDNNDTSLFSFCVQPIVDGRGIIGLVGIFKSSGVPYDQTDNLHFASAVSRAALGLESERLGHSPSAQLIRAEEEIARLRALETLSTRVSATLDPKMIAERVSASALELIPGLDVGSVWVADRNLERLDLLAEKGYPKGHFAKKSFVGINEDYAIAKVVRTGKPEYREDLTKEMNFESGKWVAQRADLKALACFPLKGKDKMLGSLFVASHRPRGWSQHERSFLEAIASLVAQALENSLLYQQTEAQRKWLQTIIDQMPEAVIIAEAPSSRITMANKASARLLGYQVGVGREMLGHRGVRGLYWPNGELCPVEELPLIRSLKTGETYLGVELLVKRQDGSFRIIASNSSALRDADGNILGSVVVSQDITDVKEVERLKDEFLAAASHELRTPLTSIRGFTQSMARQLDRRLIDADLKIVAQHDIERKRMDLIIRQVDRLTALVDELMNVSRLQRDIFSMTWGTVDMAALIASVVEKLQVTSEKHHLSLEVEKSGDGIHSEPSAFYLVGDERRLEDVLTNLIHNAIKFSPRGGEVDLKLARVDGEIIVTVSDQGIGVPSHQFEEIFKPFSQASNVSVRQYGGLGLGLYLCHEIIDRHGGRIWTERSDETGSVFCFKLPGSSLTEVGRA